MARIIYSDRYVGSPLVGRLLLEAASGIANALGVSGKCTTIKLISRSIDLSSRRPVSDTPFLLGHDWRSDALRNAVLTSIAESIGLTLSVELRAVRHAREMLLEFIDGSTIAIMLDQGFGCWREPRNVRPRFDFAKPPSEQAEQLRMYGLVVNGPTDPSYLVVSKM